MNKLIFNCYYFFLLSVMTSHHLLKLNVVGVYNIVLLLFHSFHIIFVTVTDLLSAYIIFLVEYYFQELKYFVRKLRI